MRLVMHPTRSPRSLWDHAAVVVVRVGLAIAVAVRVFGLTAGGALALYFVVWWIMPVRRPAVRRPQPGRSRRASTAGDATRARRAAPALREKALWTTLRRRRLVLARRSSAALPLPAYDALPALGSECDAGSAAPDKEKARLAPCSNCPSAIIDPWLLMPPPLTALEGLVSSRNSDRRLRTLRV